MARQNIYKTMSVASVMPATMIADLADFLITHRSYILPPEKTTEAFRTRFSGHSFVTEIVHRLSMAGKDQTYSLIRLPSKTLSLREVIDMTFVPVDCLQMTALLPTSSTSLSLHPQLHDKLVINITDITKSNGDFADISQFQHRVVRDFLTRSFYVAPGNIWLQPALIRYVAKVYSMTIGAGIARQFGLYPQVQTFVQAVFCLFFITKMTTAETAVDFVKAHHRYMGLPDIQDIQQIIDFTHDTLGRATPLSLEDVCQLIDAYDHSQLKDAGGTRINRPFLNRRFSSWFSDGQVAMIALEYPPYFLYLMLLVLSNVRVGLSFPMKQFNLITEGRDLVEQALKSPTFLQGL